MKISTWLNESSRELRMIDSAKLDVEIILAHTLNRPRTWLRAHDDEEIDLRRQQIADARVQLRKDRIPLAYIIGHKEFYGRRFLVSTATLIPRPESEQMIEFLRELLPSSHGLDIPLKKRLVDIGTGSGCLGITAKLEHPELEVTLIDVSQPALTIARKNASALNAAVSIEKGDLLTSYPYSPDIILANLPYVDRSWERSEETTHEPDIALFAGDDGLKLIKQCFRQAADRSPVGGLVFIEADPRQNDSIIAEAKQCGFHTLRQSPFVIVFEKD